MKKSEQKWLEVYVRLKEITKGWKHVSDSQKNQKKQV